MRGVNTGGRLNRRLRRSNSIAARRCVCPLLPLLLALGMAGCSVNLYSDLIEREATEVMAELLDNGIGCDKVQGKDAVWAIRVGKSHAAQAVGVLRRKGLPRDRFATMGDVFKKEGLISSPLEERVRYIYSLSQEIAETITRIDGVITARVHIVLPENDPLADSLIPSSASVFIKCRPEAFEVKSRVPLIKQMVINSVEGLNVDNVAVAVFPAAESDGQENAGLESHLGISIHSDSVMNFWVLVGLLFTGALAGGASAAYSFISPRLNSLQRPNNAKGSVA